MPPPRPSGHSAETPKRNHSLKDFGGVNTQADRTAIQEGEFLWLENLMPVGHANMRAVPAASATLVTAANTIIYWQYVNIGGVDQALVFLSNGAGYTYDLNATLTLFAAAATFTGTPHVAQWKNDRALIIATNGYWSWDGATLTTLNGTVLSVTITVPGSGYTGRPTVTFGSGGATGLSVVGLVLASLAAAGAGYAVGDVLTLVGGTFTTAAQITVTTVSGTGAVTAAAITRKGDYTVMPGSPVATTGGFGAGATLTSTWGVVGVTLLTVGSGYVSAPTITFTLGGGSGAAATANLSSAPNSGTTIATYSGRVWISSGRTIIYSAPDSYTDFSLASSGGSTIVTDESLHSDIVAMMANNGYLYVFGSNAVNIISDVRVSTTGSTAGLTQFSNNNITNAVGTSFPASLVSYARSILFADSYGFHGIFGATVKKASDKIDGTFPYVDTTKTISSGLALLFNNIVPCFLFQYLDPTNNGTSRPILACLRDGKWFFCSQGTDLTLVLGAYKGDSPLMFATNGTAIKRLFYDSSAAIDTTMRTAFMPFDEPWTIKQAQKLGIEFTSSNFLTGIAVMQTEIGQSASITQSNGNFIFQNNSGVVVNFYNSLGVLMQFVVSGRQVFQGDVQTYGRYLGVQWTSSSPNYTLNGVLMQWENRAQWGSLPNSGI